MGPLAALDRRRATAGSPFRRPVALASPAEQSAMAFRMLPGISVGWPHEPEMEPAHTLREGMANAIVYRCIDGKATRCASVPWRTWELTDSGKGKIVDMDPVARLIEFPHRDGAFGRQKLVYRSAMYLEGVGNALVRRVGGGARERLARAGLMATAPAEELHSEVPIGVRAIPDPVRFIRAYEYDREGETAGTWDAAEIIHVMYEDPLDPYWGLSRLRAIARTVDLSAETDRLRLARAQNNGAPAVVIVDPRITTREQREEAEEKLRQRRESYRGGFMVLGGDGTNAGATLTKLGLSNQELEIVQSAAFDRDLAAIAFGYLTAGFSGDAATYSNSEIFVRHEWSLAQAVNRVLAEAFTRRLIPRDQWGRRWVAPDYSGVPELQENKPETAKALRDLRDSGVPVNAARAYLDMELGDIEGGDEPIVPGNFVSLRSLLEADSGAQGRL